MKVGPKGKLQKTLVFLDSLCKNIFMKLRDHNTIEHLYCPFGKTSYLVMNVEWKFTRESENISADHQGVDMMRNISQKRSNTGVKV